MTDSPIAIQGAVQHYDWGGKNLIPKLLQLDNADQQAFAEYWLGTHDRGPSSLPEQQCALTDWIKKQEGGNGQLSFLLKILDVDAMLSIQAHPTLEAAKAGFAKEEALGIPIGARHRSYRDQNHKPELMVALTPFWLLHGFRPKEDILTDLQALPLADAVIDQLKTQDLASFYAWWMRLPAASIDEYLSPLREKLLPLYAEGLLDKSSPDYWVAKAFQDPRFAHQIADRGMLSIYMLHLLELAPGEAIFQPAGMLHAYLEGANVEIMATSDNVFRGGLTTKHIDVEGLLQHLNFSAIQPQIIAAQPEAVHQQFPVPVSDFSLERWQLPTGHQAQLREHPSLRIGIIISGQLTIGGRDFGQGNSFLLPAGQAFELTANADSQVFIAS